MKRILLLTMLLMSSVGFTQIMSTYEKPPVFKECESEIINDIKSCFNYTLNNFIYENFNVPEVAEKESYNGAIQVLFEVDKEGIFKVIYADAIYEELTQESKRVFKLLPKIQPATYNGNPTFVQYSITIKIPLKAPVKVSANLNDDEMTQKDSLNATLSHEFDAVNDQLKPYEKLEYTSELNIPFTHSYYAHFDAEMNAIGTNSHTAAKPFVYSDVAKYYDINAEKESLLKAEKFTSFYQLTNKFFFRQIEILNYSNF